MADPDLRGLRVWVTRPAAQARNLIDLISVAGGEAVAVPTLAIVAPAGAAGLPARARAALESSRVVIFVSRNAVDWLWRWLGEAAAPLCRRTSVLAVGPGTAAALAQRGVDSVLRPETGADSEALLALPALEREAVDGGRVVIVRGEGGRELLAETLRARGAHIEYLEVYRREPDAGTRARLPVLWRDRPPAAIVASSPAGLDALLEMFDPAERPALRALPLICIGRRLAEHARGLGFIHCHGVAAGAGDRGAVNVLYDLQSGKRDD